jgi:hypothetical protein
MYEEWMAHRTCQFCKESDSQDNLVKYGVRHYAHFKCYLDAGKTLDTLHAWQVGKFPFFLLRDRGLLDEAEVIKAAKIKRDAEFEAELAERAAKRNAAR